MIPFKSTPFIRRIAMTGLLTIMAVALPLDSHSQTKPAQKPLLSATTGAKPNLMIALDNSGSMVFPFHETYGVKSGYELKYCPGPDYSSSSSSISSSFNNGIGGEANYSNGTYTCYVRSCSGWGCSRERTNVAVPYNPRKWSNTKWAAQRSAEVNPIYYNPRVTYSPRVDANGAPLKPNDGIVFVSNQNSAEFIADFYRRKNDISEVRLVTTFYEDNPDVSGWERYTGTGTFKDSHVPQHKAHLSVNSDTPSFTYTTTCDAVVTSGGLQTDCTNPKTVDIKPGSPASVPLPSDHTRTDEGCSADACTNAAEIKNILNWYRYYGFRAPAVVTSIGQALANPEYSDKLRLGYVNINEHTKDSKSVTYASGKLFVPYNSQVPGVVTDNVGFVRGVRNHKLGSPDTQSIYTWLYDQDGSQNRTSNSGKDPEFRTNAPRRFAPNGGTPLHNVLDLVADYYTVGSSANENPWLVDPSKKNATKSNEELTCRRSFTLLFSDGAWNKNSATASTNKDYDNITGEEFSRKLPNGKTEKFKYSPTGSDTAAGRKLYTPYPSSATKGLADLTARYYWNTDFRPDLDNGIQTRPGQPAFWQNMTTYTVGYQIQPTGSIPSAKSGLTFEQIEDYQTDYATNGYAAAAKPSWSTGDLDTSNNNQDRVDDFIQAGFTGGGRGFSVQSAKDVRDAFDTILADILNASGRDAGVAVSADTSNTSTIAGLLKYSVSYKTLDNSGDIIAQKLDEDGNIVRDSDDLPLTEWSAAGKLPKPEDRKVFTITGETTGIELKGNFSAIAHNDVKAAIKYGPDADRVANDASFINYLRGLDPVADANGKLFRQRAGKLGAMVNPPSIYMGGSRDFAYDLSPTGTVTGKSSYLDYVKRKQALPASLLVATNAGMVHDLNAKTGEELAAFMPRRSLKRMLNYANDDYKFEYTLDGPLSEHDIFDSKDWNHLAVGTGGRGERMIYALRSPLNGTSAAGNRIPTEKDFLWEVGPTGGPKTVGSTAEDNTINDSTFNLGHITQPARSGQTEDGQWVVVVNSGHHNDFTNGSRHGLLVLDAMTGATIKKIPLPATYSAGRGLSGVTLVRNAEQRIVAAYAGDANGNLWRFNLRGTDDKWSVSYGKPMFTTANNRPIYGAPAWQAHPKGGTIVVVATGMLLDEADVGDTASSLADKTKNEAIYGIWDPTVIGEADASPFTTVPTSSLLVQSIKTGSEQTNKDKKFYTTTKEPIDWSTQRGWTFALGHSHIGERNIDQVRNVGTSVFINTTVVKAPEETDVETCTAAGLPVNYLYGLRAIDGATQYSFDVDGNGKLDNVSMVLLTNGGFSRGIAFANIQKSEISETLRRTQDSIDTGSGESSTSVQKCVNINKKGIGTEEGAIGLGTYCPVQGWSRSQYQLSAPPVN